MSGIREPRSIAAWRFLPTLLIGALGGAFAYGLAMPLPWLLGALLATTAASLAGVKLRAPGVSRKAVLVVIGVMLGSAFAPGMIDNTAIWGESLFVMLLATALMMALSVWFGRRIAGYSIETAVYSAVPGGVSAVTLMAADSRADLRIVGLTHAVRILTLLVALPLVLNMIGHVSMQPRSMSTAQWLSVPAFGDAVWLLAAGVVGLLAGRWLRLPNPLLFGPVFLSAALHVTGVTHALPPPTVVALAQVVIGVSVGVRFVGTRLADIGYNLLMAVIQAGLLLLIAVSAAWIMHLATGYSQAAALLAYMPGGAPELSLVALSLGIDPAFVTSHHLVRISALILLMPTVLAGLKRVSA